MNEFDSQTAAATSQVGWEKLSESPGAKFAELIADTLTVFGMTNPVALTGKMANILLKVRRLAGSSFEDNVAYVFENVCNDLHTLYETCEAIRCRIQNLPSDPEFQRAISALVLRTMHTSAKERLKRLARIVVNGVRDEDLKEEGLNDLLKAATDLTDEDVRVLRDLAGAQKKYAQRGEYLLSEMHGAINFPRELWQTLVSEGFITPKNHLAIRSSLVRLQALGFGAEIQTMESVWYPRFVISPDGEKFLSRLRELDQ